MLLSPSLSLFRDQTCYRPHRFNEPATESVNSGMESPDWNVSMVDIHLRKLLWVYCPGHAGVKGNDRADRLPWQSKPHKWLASWTI